MIIRITMRIIIEYNLSWMQTSPGPTHSPSIYMFWILCKLNKTTSPYSFVWNDKNSWRDTSHSQPDLLWAWGSFYRMWPIIANNTSCSGTWSAGLEEPRTHNNYLHFLGKHLNSKSQNLPWIGGTIKIRAVTGLIQIHGDIRGLSVIERTNGTVLVIKKQ